MQDTTNHINLIENTINECQKHTAECDKILNLLEKDPYITSKIDGRSTHWSNLVLKDLANIYIRLHIGNNHEDQEKLNDLRATFFEQKMTASDIIAFKEILSQQCSEIPPNKADQIKTDALSLIEKCNPTSPEQQLYVSPLSENIISTMNTNQILLTHDTTSSTILELESELPFSSEEVSLRTNIQTDTFHSTMTPNGIESTSPSIKIQVTCDNILTKIKTKKPIGKLNLNTQELKDLSKELENRKKANPADKEIISKALKNINGRIYDKIDRTAKAKSDGFESIYYKRNQASLKNHGKSISTKIMEQGRLKAESEGYNSLYDKRNQASLDSYGKNLYTRSSERAESEGYNSLYDKNNQASLEKYHKIPYQRQKEVSIEKYGKTPHQRRNEAAKGKGFCSYYAMLKTQALERHFNNVIDMMLQVANEQNLNINHNVLTNFERFLQTQDTLNDALQKPITTQPNELSNQQQESPNPIPHLQQQIGKLDTQIENILSQNDEISYLLNYFEKTYGPSKTNNQD